MPPPPRTYPLDFGGSATAGGTGRGDGSDNAIMFLRQETSEFALNEELPVFKVVRISADKLGSNENTRVGGRG